MANAVRSHRESRYNHKPFFYCHFSKAALQFGIRAPDAARTDAGNCTARAKD